MSDALFRVLAAEVAIGRIVRLTNGKPAFRFDNWEQNLLLFGIVAFPVVRLFERPRLINWLNAATSVVVVAYFIARKSRQGVRPRDANSDGASESN